MSTKQNVHLHGDITLYPSKAKSPAKADRKKVHVLQASGVTGNRHEVAHDTASVARWSKDGKEYVSCTKPFVLRHVGGDSEHGEQQVATGTYEVRREMEHDPWNNELRAVID